MRRERQTGGYYVEVADVEGGLYHSCPEFPLMFILQDLAEKAAEWSLSKYAVARVCREEVVFRRDDQHKPSGEVVSEAD